MKKFDRLPQEQRRQEIRGAALELFCEKGFGATTMENIVSRVSLSKGGVYRIYPSTESILEDLMLTGMHLRNAYYEEQVRKRMEAGEGLTLSWLVELVGDSLLLYPDIAAVYVEFLWEKRRSPRLEALYRQIVETTTGETLALMEKYGADSLCSRHGMELLTEYMNGTILSLQVLDLRQEYESHRNEITQVICDLLNKEREKEKTENA